MMPKTLQFQSAEEDFEDDEELLYNGTSFLYDFKKGDFIYEKGNPVLVSGKEALKIWIEKIIRTRAGAYNIYSKSDDSGLVTDREYGTDIWALIRGQKLPALVIEAETKRDIEEAMSLNHKILRIENYRVEQGYGNNGHKLGIEFDVITVDTEEDFQMEVII